MQKLYIVERDMEIPLLNLFCKSRGFLLFERKKTGASLTFGARHFIMGSRKGNQVFFMKRLHFMVKKILPFLAGGMMSFPALWAGDTVTTINLQTSVDPVPYEFYVKYYRDDNSGSQYSGSDFLTNQIYDSSLDLTGSSTFASFFTMYIKEGGTEEGTTTITFNITDTGFIRDEDGGSGENTVPTTFTGIYPWSYNDNPEPLEYVSSERVSDELLTYTCKVGEGIVDEHQLFEFSLRYGAGGEVPTGVYRDEITFDIELTTEA